MEPEFINSLAHIFKAIGWVFLPVLLTPTICLIFKKQHRISAFQFSLIEIIDGTNLKIGEWTKWLLVILVVTIAFGVIALSIFGQSWTKLDESATYFHTLVILLGSAATLLAGEHVRVDIFYSKMHSRAKVFVDILGLYAFNTVGFC